MKTQHTPGPWYLCGDFTRKIVDVDESYYWTRVYSESDAEIAPARAYGVTKEEAESNAALIAAAPELLEALLLVRAEMWKCERTDILEIVDSVITKAKGDNHDKL